MLALSRKKGESIVIGDEIEITYVIRNNNFEREKIWNLKRWGLSALNIMGL